MATRFNFKITRTEEGFEKLMQVVEAHRRKFSVKTKSDLQSFIRYLIILCINVVNYHYFNFKS